MDINFAFIIFCLTLIAVVAISSSKDVLAKSLVNHLLDMVNVIHKVLGRKSDRE